MPDRKGPQLFTAITSAEVCRKACTSAEGKAALYYLVGEIANLPAYCVIPPDDHGISVKELLKLIEDLQKEKRR